MDAIYTLKALENQHRDATPEEQETLANYVGWGGLADAFDAEKTAWTGEYKELKAALTEEEYAAARASTLNAHYTSPTVIRAIYEALDGMGLRKAIFWNRRWVSATSSVYCRIPCWKADCMVWNWIPSQGALRRSCIRRQKSRWQVLKPPTAAISMIWPWAMCHLATTVSAINPMISSVFSIHNYFFAKALDQVRPGGIVAFVTSRYTMDSKNPDARKYLAQRAELLGAIRLPNNAFRANAGTDVVSDIIFSAKERPSN